MVGLLQAKVVAVHSYQYVKTCSLPPIRPHHAQTHNQLLRKRVPSASFSHPVYHKPQATPSSTAAASAVAPQAFPTAPAAQHDSTVNYSSTPPAALIPPAEALARAQEAVSRAAPCALFSKAPRWADPMKPSDKAASSPRQMHSTGVSMPDVCDRKQPETARSCVSEMYSPGSQSRKC